LALARVHAIARRGYKPAGSAFQGRWLAQVPTKSIERGLSITFVVIGKMMSGNGEAGNGYLSHSSAAAAPSHPTASALLTHEDSVAPHEDLAHVAEEPAEVRADGEDRKKLKSGPVGTRGMGGPSGGCSAESRSARRIRCCRRGRGPS